MGRTQISTGVSQRTREQANELIKKNGYSLRELIAIAIDRMHREELATGCRGKMANRLSHRICQNSYRQNTIEKGLNND